MHCPNIASAQSEQWPNGFQTILLLDPDLITQGSVEGSRTKTAQSNAVFSKAEITGGMRYGKVEERISREWYRVASKASCNAGHEPDR